MNLITLERSQANIDSGHRSIRHLTWVVVTRGGMVQAPNRLPTYTVWLSATPEIGESRQAITQTMYLGYASKVASALAGADLQSAAA